MYYYINLHTTNNIQKPLIVNKDNVIKIDSLEEQKETNKIISNKLRNLEVNKMLVKNYVRKAAVVGIAAVAGMSLFACKKAETPLPKADIRIDVDADISDGNKINEKEELTKGTNLKDKNGRYIHQESIKDEYGNIIDWNNKITEINDSNHTELSNIKGFINLEASRKIYCGMPCYAVNIGDEKNWEIGPNGYPNPPEELKERTPVTWKDGAKIPDNQMEFIKRTQMSWIISYQIDGKLYQISGSDRVGSGRTVYLVEPGTDCDSGIPPKILMEVSNKNKSTNEELLIMCISNDDIVKQIKKGAPIKDSLIQGK